MAAVFRDQRATTKSYELHNGRNRIWLSQIGNSGSGERGGSLYIEYSGSNADGIKISGARYFGKQKCNYPNPLP